MQGRRLLWQLYPSYLLLLFVVLISLSWYGASSFKAFFVEQKIIDLKAATALVEPEIANSLSKSRTKRLKNFALNLADQAALRLTIANLSGEVLSDSEESAPSDNNILNRPEIQQALSEGVGHKIRQSGLLAEQALYVARRIDIEGKPAGLLRVSLPVTDLDTALYSTYWRLALVTLILALFAALISRIVAGKILKPLELIQQGVERFSSGDLEHKLHVEQDNELGQLSKRMNEMAQHLNERIRTMSRQRNEFDAVLTSMMEGVIAIGPDERILNMNRAAAQLLGIQNRAVRGQDIRNIVRSTPLKEFIEEVEASGGPRETEILLPGANAKILKSYGRILKDGQGEIMGVLIVLNDVTQIKKLENIRKEFVANVSHELRTPITSIKGFVETLMDGALEDEEEARRFLNIIDRHADRLSAIIEDLLTLSRIEVGTEGTDLERSDTPLRDVIEAALLMTEQKAALKGIRVSIDCDDSIFAKINPPLMEQAILNLLDNAIKYSNEDKQVRVKVFSDHDEIRICVEDQGMGIEHSHLPRLFERFYRVDKARSAEMSGTGLGLALVKHIAQAHNGHAEVQSEYGSGSTFTIHLPREHA